MTAYLHQEKLHKSSLLRNDSTSPHGEKSENICHIKIKYVILSPNSESPMHLKMSCP